MMFKVTMTIVDTRQESDRVTPLNDAITRAVEHERGIMVYKIKCMKNNKHKHIANHIGFCKVCGRMLLKDSA